MLPLTLTVVPVKLVALTLAPPNTLPPVMLPLTLTVAPLYVAANTVLKKLPVAPILPTALPPLFSIPVTFALPIKYAVVGVNTATLAVPNTVI